MKRLDLLILVAIWEFISAFLAMIGVVAIAVFAFPAIFDASGEALIGGLFVLGFATLLLLAVVGLGVASGIGVLLGREWGRIMAIVHAVLSVFNVPVGTVVGVLILVYLVRPEVQGYFRGADSAVALSDARRDAPSPGTSE